MELGEVQEQFANIIWNHEPISSGELVKICERELNWKKPTTYTVLRKLCEKGLFRNSDGRVTAIVSRDEYKARRSEQVIDDVFEGSLPAFIAAFASSRKMTRQDFDEISKVIAEFKTQAADSNKGES